MKRATLIVLTALFTLGLVACDRPATDPSAQLSSDATYPEKSSTDKTSPSNPSNPPSGTPPASPAVDAALSEKVRQALVSEHGVNARDLQVTAQDGVVTLSGKVEEKSDQERMMLVAMSIDGVRSVVSNLVVDRPA